MRETNAVCSTPEYRPGRGTVNLRFLPSSTPPESAGPPDLGVDLSICRRPFGVALAAALAALLHGGILFWFLERPVSEPPTEAVPLPVIDISLSGSSRPAPSQPVETAKQMPKTKPEPKSVKKKKSESKPTHLNPAIHPEQSREENPEARPAAFSPPSPVPADAASPRAETFRPASSNADYLNNPRPLYPVSARRRHWEGLVLLRVFVTEEGHSGKVSVNRSSGHKVLDEAALEAVSQWRFVPAKRGDIAQASWVTVPIEFQLK